MTLSKLLEQTTSFLAAHSVDSPRLTAELLAAHVLGVQRLELALAAKRPVTESEMSRLQQAVERRAKGEPLQYIIGTVEFCGLVLAVDKRALIPRPETELLVETVVYRLRSTLHASLRTDIRILDLCTGSGCVAVALAKLLPEAHITAVDISGDALALARENAMKNGVGDNITFLRGDLFKPLGTKKSVDAIVSNPPYVSESAFSSLQREICEHEPRAALVGGTQGTEIIEKIIRQSRAFLFTSGLLALEIGFDQRRRVKQFLDESDFKEVEFVQDLAGHSRVVVARNSNLGASTVC